MDGREGRAECEGEVVRQMTINAAQCQWAEGRSVGNRLRAWARGRPHASSPGSRSVLALPSGLLTPWEVGAGRAPTSFPSQAALYLALGLLLLLP